MRMSSKRWLICFFLSLALILSAVAAFNIITDPFGIFGDRFYNWYAANMTRNPAAAKIAYIDLNHEKYDSYIIGSSGTSSFPVEKLNEYTGASFYNLFSYGADMEKTYLTAKYVLENYEVKNLVICVGIMDAVNYKKYGDSVSETLHANITGEFAPSFYAKYLFATPKYGFYKIDYYNVHNTYFPKFFDVFDADTGAYDDRLQSIERIGNINAYLEDFPELKEENRLTYTPYLPYIDECVERIADIKRLADEKGTDLKVIFMPSYYYFCKQLDLTQVAILYNKLAAVCDFWDFLISSASLEARYFYDYMHFRNDLGAMALARVYGDEEAYIAEDFGFYVTAENNAEYAGQLWRKLSEVSAAPDISATFSVLRYREIDPSGNSSEGAVSPERLEEHLATLSDAGYNTVSVSDIINFVEKGTPLPENAVLLTFDGGYTSIYEYVYPILKKYGMNASAFTTGISVGTGQYFGWNQAREMSDSGVFEIGSHSYNMHTYPSGEIGLPVRYGVLRMDGETEDEYISALCSDLEKFIEVYKQNMSVNPAAFAFPYGRYEKIAESLLREYGFKVTFTTETGINEIVKGIPQSLYGLARYTLSESMSGEDLLNLLK